MTASDRSRFELSGIPRIGFGTYQLNGRNGAEALQSALDVGYRLLDSAVSYGNEGMVGSVIRHSSVPRNEIVITSKLAGRHQSHSEALISVEESLYRTGLDRIDLYLIHWPNPGQDRYVEAWSGLLEAKSRGYVTEIGVCNFLPSHLERLENATGQIPLINQVELHPYFPQTDLLQFHGERGITTQAWSPLGRGNDLLSNSVVTAVAERNNISSAQAVLAWHLSFGIVPIPKSSAIARQRENLRSTDHQLSVTDIAAISTLARLNGRNAGLDPATYEEM